MADKQPSDQEKAGADAANETERSGDAGGRLRWIKAAWHADPFYRLIARYNADEMPVVPRTTVVSRALILVIAVMCCLACLSLGAAWIVNRTASQWSEQAGREVTVQIRPIENENLDQQTTSVLALLSAYDGITDVRVYSSAETKALLEPWLGAGLDLDALPVPRLIALEIDAVRPPKLAALAEQLRLEVAGASLDDHRVWQQQMRAVTSWLKMAAIFIFLLMLGATLLITIFATRAAMAGNKDIVTVLHLVGAQEKFIATEFQQHFLILGLRAGVIGGIVAAAGFMLAEIAASRLIESPGHDAMMLSLLSSLWLGWDGFGALAAVVALIAALTALTSRFTVFYFLRNVE